jgi:uncharacterized membrane protein YecN with MAPEG domain
MNQTAIAAVGIYAALNTLILVWLGTVTSRLRTRHRVLIGDGGVEHLQRVMRGHANAVENMPITFVLLTIAALLGAPTVAIHILGAIFTFGRALHAWHFVQARAPQWQRFTGYGLGALATGLAAIGVLGHAIVILF